MFTGNVFSHIAVYSGLWHKEGYKYKATWRKYHLSVRRHPRARMHAAPKRGRSFTGYGCLHVYHNLDQESSPEPPGCHKTL
eukprot:2796132-Amphidinium_carterae.1